MDIRKDLKKYFQDNPSVSPIRLAELTGVHFTVLYRIMAGKYDPRLSTVQKLWPYLYENKQKEQ